MINLFPTLLLGLMLILILVLLPLLQDEPAYHDERQHTDKIRISQSGD